MWAKVSVASASCKRGFGLYLARPQPALGWPPAYHPPSSPQTCPTCCQRQRRCPVKYKPAASGGSTSSCSFPPVFYALLALALALALLPWLELPPQELSSGRAPLFNSCTGGRTSTCAPTAPGCLPERTPREYRCTFRHKVPRVGVGDHVPALGPVLPFSLTF